MPFFRVLLLLGIISHAVAFPAPAADDPYASPPPCPEAEQQQPHRSAVAPSPVPPTVIVSPVEATHTLTPSESPLASTPASIYEPSYKSHISYTHAVNSSAPYQRSQTTYISTIRSSVVFPDESRVTSSQSATRSTGPLPSPTVAPTFRSSAASSSSSRSSVSSVSSGGNSSPAGSPTVRGSTTAVSSLPTSTPVRGSSSSTVVSGSHSSTSVRGSSTVSPVFTSSAMTRLTVTSSTTGSPAVRPTAGSGSVTTTRSFTSSSSSVTSRSSTGSTTSPNSRASTSSSSSTATRSSIKPPTSSAARSTTSSTNSISSTISRSSTSTSSSTSSSTARSSTSSNSSTISRSSTTKSVSTTLTRPSTTSSSSTTRSSSTSKNSTPTPTPSCTASFWLDDIKHQGAAPYNGATGYKVYRNVKSFGAKGDGVTDDTAAINQAIQSGNRKLTSSSTTTLAVVYFPAGTYLISGSVIDYSYTQIIGNPNCMPVLKATANFTGFGLIDGNPYGSNGLSVGSTNSFYKQVNNIVFDTTNIPATTAATGIHWPVSQACSIYNCVFKLADGPGTQHQGVFIEEGSGGWMNDLTIFGGLYGLNQGSQQFSIRNVSISNAVTGISQIWDWGFTYKNININNCTVGLNATGAGPAAQSVSAVTVVDSVFDNVRTGIITAWDKTSQPSAAGALNLENVQFSGVMNPVANSAGVVYVAESYVAAYSQGNYYNADGFVSRANGNISPALRPPTLLGGPNGGYYERSKPQYDSLPASSFVSARDSGAAGDAITDDTAALQSAVNRAASSGKVLFVDAGTYRVTDTILVPAGSRITGEGFASIMSSGQAFANMNAPRAVVQVGQSGDSGIVEISNIILSTQSGTGVGQGGAVLVQWNLASPATSPSGAWDVHARVGGFQGSNQQAGDCIKTPTVSASSATIKPQCIAANTLFHITQSGSGVYLENNWLWVADHDLDSNQGNFEQLAIYSGRGMLIESRQGNIWLYGHACQHNSLYQYNFVNTQYIVGGQLQTETAYYQPNPDAPTPFTPDAGLHDPTFDATPYTSSSGASVPNADGYGLRIVDSHSIVLYGVGLYSFFNDFDTTCSAQGNGAACQSRIFSVENSEVTVYDLHTVGTNQIITLDGKDIASYAANVAGFSTEVALFTS